MTSASELFHTRRNRLGRSALDLGLDSSSPASQHHDHRPRHRSSYSARAADRFDRTYRRSLLNDAQHVRGPTLTASGTLPVGVVLARARLLERLRGDPVSSNRQFARDSVVRDQESELSDVPSADFIVTNLTSQMGRSQLLHELNKKPPGLTQEALDCLHLEVFSSREIQLEESRILQDCCICLESFADGDELIRLPCGHKFHSACLHPWIRCCGACPYCRRGIVVNTHLPPKEAEEILD